MQNIKGRAWKVGHDVDTDLIIAARYLNRIEPEFLAAHCLEDLIPGILAKVETGDILVAGRNFGCGSSREHAPIALWAAGFRCVLAESFARIFYRNAINVGLPIIVAPEAAAAIQEGDNLEVDPSEGIITNTSKEQHYRGEPFPPFMREILECGGLIPYVAKKVKKND